MTGHPPLTLRQVTGACLQAAHRRVDLAARLGPHLDGQQCDALAALVDAGRFTTDWRCNDRRPALVALVRQILGRCNTSLADVAPGHYRSPVPTTTRTRMPDMTDPTPADAKPRGECQICGGDQAVQADGTIHRHGYKRPGWGWLVGGCMGTGHQPYPAWDALAKAVDAAQDRITHLAALAARPDLPVPVAVRYEYRGRNRVAVTETARTEAEYLAIYAAHPKALRGKGWVERVDGDGQVRMGSGWTWDKVRARRVTELQREAQHVARTRDEWQARMDAAKALDNDPTDGPGAADNAPTTTAPDTPAADDTRPTEDSMTKTTRISIAKQTADEVATVLRARFGADAGNVARWRASRRSGPNAEKYLAVAALCDARAADAGEDIDAKTYDAVDGKGPTNASFTDMVAKVRDTYQPETNQALADMLGVNVKTLGGALRRDTADSPYTGSLVAPVRAAYAKALRGGKGAQDDDAADAADDAEVSG